jgi:phage gpG-like protein
MTASIRKVGDWAGAEQAMRQAPRRAEQAIDRALTVVGHHMVARIVANMGSGLEPPLAPSTIRTRKVKGGRGGRGTKPLIKTGELRNSITVIKSKGEVFVGVPRSSGKYRLAKIHENGTTIVLRITPKMRAFLFGVLIPPSQQVSGVDTGWGSGLIVVQIPARPFIAPVFEAYQDEAARLFEQTFTEHMGLT